MKNRIIIAVVLCFLALPAFAQQSVSLEPLDNGLRQSVVTITTSATAIPATALAGRKSVIIQNIGSVTVYLGASTVTADETATGGFQLQSDGDALQIDIGENTVLYGIVAAATSPVVIIEVR